MEAVGAWIDGAATVLSCPGPLRRHDRALLPVAGLVLPQVLLGSESQLLAFAAHAARALPGVVPLFAPFPEMFAGWRSVAEAVGRAGGDAARGVVHLRFGGVRAARVLKGARNAAVLAECAGPALLTASHHPFASGTVLPAAIGRAFLLADDVLRPSGIGGAVLPAGVLPAGLATADLRPPDPGRAEAAIEMTSLADFASGAWAAGGVAGSPGGMADGTPAVLLPWNMDHPGSLVPELLVRLAMLGAPEGALPRFVLLPFNYIGQTGIIRTVIERVREASSPAGALLGRVFLARVGTLDGVAALTRLGRVAWVDGNDPEHWWTLARLQALGIACVLIGADAAGGAGRAAGMVPADEAVWVEAETRCGTLIFAARLPAWRTLKLLLRMTAERQGAGELEARPVAEPAARAAGGKRRRAR